MAPRIHHNGLVLAALLALSVGVQAQGPKGDGPPAKGGPPMGGKAGVSVNDARAFQGYTLVAPMNSTKTYLIDLDGRVVHTWECNCTPALVPYLLDNGNLLRPGAQGKGGPGAPGAGGRVQEYSWDGKLLWDYTFAGKNQHPHHDICRLPNGNVLLIVADHKNTEEAIAAGRRPEGARNGVIADAILEIKPTGKTTGEIVWEWHAWDHLVQDQDKTKDNYGKVGSAPGRIDINYGQGMFGKMVAKKDDQDKLRALGYLGGQGGPGGDKGGPGGKGDKGGKGGPGGGFNPGADWTHFNAVDYNAELDQIMISVHSFSEFWIIDHSTTTMLAAGKTGGKYGKGGDLLYRWGNPQAYRSGSNADQRLFQQHNAHWIPKGLPGAGHVLVFNNGGRRPDGSYSSIDEVVLPLTTSGSYERKPGLAFGPRSAAWSYVSPGKSDFFAPLISGTQRLPNGNTLICNGPGGLVFEVTPSNEVVWKFQNPQKGGGPGGFGGGGFFAMPKPGEILARDLQERLKLTDSQRQQLEIMQKDVDAQLAKLLTDEQREELKKMRDGGPGFGPPGGFAGFGGKGPGGRGGMGRGGPGMGPGPGGLFRAYRFGANHPAFEGKTLTPGKRIEDL